MRTINKGPRTGDEIVAASSIVKAFNSDMEPCWYADSEEQGDVLVWKIGISGSENDEEHSFEFDNSSGHKSEHFVCSLLDKYKQGGREAVENWLKNGCP